VLDVETVDGDAELQAAAASNRTIREPERWHLVEGRSVPREPLAHALRLHLKRPHVVYVTSAKYFGQEGTFIKRRFMVLA